MTHPEWKEPIARILPILERVPERGVIDPMNIAVQASLDPLETLGMLRVLATVGIGQLIVRVVDNDGDEVARYPTVRAIPPRVPTAFGEEIEVTPQNIDLTFEPSAPRAEIRRLAEQVSQ